MNLQIRSLLRCALGELLEALGPAMDDQPPAPECFATPPAGPKLTPLESDILHACKRFARKAESIALLLGRECNSYFRERLTELVKSGRLQRTSNGYMTAT